MGFNLDDYEPVADRVAQFYQDHPDGWIGTKIEHLSDDFVVVKAFLGYTSDGFTVATGHALQTLGLGGNSAEAKAPLEVCETSAVGRALANAGYQAKGRASREEMEKVIGGPGSQGVDKTTLLESMDDEERQAFKAALLLEFPGIALGHLPPSGGYVERVEALALDVVAQRYAQPPENTPDLSEFSEEPF